MNTSSKMNEKEFSKLRHDLLNPLSIMKMNIELVKESKDYEKNSKNIRNCISILEEQVGILINKIKIAKIKK